MVGFDGYAVLHFADRKLGEAREQVGQCAVILGRQVLNQHNAHAQICAHVAEQLSERF